jgi:hypothetical protein
MANIFQSTERRVIPNFRSLTKTVNLGELDSFQVNKNHFSKSDLTDYIETFQKNRLLSFAGDLLSAALINNELENEVVVEAAKFVLQNTNDSSFSLNNLAKRILGESKSKNESKIEKIDEFLEIHTKEIIHERIRKLKELSISSIPNPFLYVELARLYSIIAQKKNAYKNILIAYNLAPNNRYVLRSFARLIAHLGDIEYAHTVLKRSPLVKNDPWLMASEIAFASLRNINSANIKIGLNFLESKNYSPFSISELAASIGTVEFLQGTRKKSKRLFEMALVKPNDNSLAQVEWANNKERLFDFSLKDFNVKNNFEAKALDEFHEGNWEKAIEYADSWFIDMPFARRPAEFGNHIATLYLDDQETAVKFCKAGLISNPHDALLLNNIAYSYALLDRPDEAMLYLNKIELNNLPDVSHKICAKATRGLIMYRKGEYLEGRRLYLEAIEEAKINKLEHYNWLAIINMANEEIKINSRDVPDLLTIVQKIPDNDDEIKLLKNRILKKGN